MLLDWERNQENDADEEYDDDEENDDEGTMRLRKGCDTIRTIKRGNQFVCLTTGSGLKFLDLALYSSPTTLAKTFAANKCGGVKGVFPYDMFTGYESLSHADVITR